MKQLAKLHIVLGFLLEVLLPMDLQVRASTITMPFPSSPTPLISTAQNPTRESQRPSTALMTLAPQAATTVSTQPSSTFQSPSLTQTLAPPSRSSVLPPEGPTTSYTTSAPNTDHGPGTLDRDQAADYNLETCEEYNKKRMLICFILIGLLFFICVVLLLAIVALASKLSHLKRRKPSKRLPRSNGDFLSTNSLWPAGLETLQRLSSDTRGTDQMVQRSGPERAAVGHEDAGEEIGKQLAKEIASRQQQQQQQQQQQERPEEAQRNPIRTAEI